MNLRKVASRQDQRVSKSTGWNIQVNSGATKGRKGDLKAPNLLVETKTIVRPCDTFKLALSWFEKAHDQAFRMGKQLSIIVYSFGKNQDYVGLQMRDFKKIFDLSHREAEIYISKDIDEPDKSRKTYTISESFITAANNFAFKNNKLFGIFTFKFNQVDTIVNMTLEDFNTIYQEYLQKQ